jgi:hypothetical protein
MLSSKEIETGLMMRALECDYIFTSSNQHPFVRSYSAQAVTQATPMKTVHLSWGMLLIGLLVEQNCTKNPIKTR